MSEKANTAGPVLVSYLLPEGRVFMAEEEVRDIQEALPPVVITENRAKEQRSTDLIQFKISLISPVIYHTHTYQSDRAYFISVAERSFTLPDGRIRRYSVKTLERWAREYKTDGSEGLRLKARSDLGSSRSLTLVVMVRIAVILKEAPQIKCTALLRRLEKKEKLLEQGTVSVDTIRRFIRLHDLRNPVVCEDRIRKSFVVDNAGDLFEADTCYLFKIPDEKGRPQWVYIQGIMDDHSRRIVAAICYMHDSAENFQRTLFHAVSTHMIPTVLYVDNGSPYICKQLKEICNRLGITLVHTRAADGAAKGCIERFWLSAVMNVLPDLILDKVTTLEGVQQAVDAYVEEYNSSLNRGVDGIPNERYQASLLRKPARRPKSMVWLREQFVNQTWCHLYNDNVIHFNCQRFRIPDEIVAKVREHYGKSIPIRYDPQDITGTISVVLNEQKHRLSLDDPSANNTGRRNTGGRKTQLAEQAQKKAEQKVSVAEQRAEERYRKRMAGIPGMESDEKEGILVPDLSSSADATSAETELLGFDYGTM